MPEFQVRWHEPAAGVRQRRVVADHAGAVAAALGVAPAQILAATPVGPAPRRWSLGIRPLPANGGVDLRLFAQELSVLLQAGVPLLEALQTLREKDAGAAALDSVCEALREGRTLSAALEGAGFDSLFVALVAASERTGQITDTLRQHAAYLAWSEALRARLTAAAIYPLLLLAAGGAVILFLLLYVLPRFAGVFDGLGHELPLASQALMSLGSAASGHPLLTLAIAVGVPLALVLAGRRPAVRVRAQHALWRSPFFGPRLRVLALARLYRTLALLLHAGVPALASLGLAEAALAAPLRRALRGTSAAVSAGVRLSQAMHSHGLATPVALRMLRVGESSGSVAAMFDAAAAFHDEEIARFSDLVTRALNPLLMLLMGGVIGGIVVLMYLPIFTLMEQVQ